MKKILKKINNQKGSTLIELIIYIALFTMIVMVIMELLIDFTSLSEKISFIAFNDNDAREVMNDITDSVLQGYNVLTPTPSNPSSNTLTIQIDSAGDSVSYFASGGQLYFQYNSNSPVAISSTNTYISNITFTREYNSGTTPAVEINLTFASPIHIGNTVTNIQTLVTERNVS